MQPLRRVQHVVVGFAPALVVVIIFARPRQLRELGVELVVGRPALRQLAAVRGVERDLRRPRERRAQDRDLREDVAADQRRPRRDRRAGVVSGDARHRLVAERIDEPGGVAHHVEDAERIAVGVVGAVPAGGAAIAALVGRDHVIAGGRERQHHLAPAIGELGKAVQQQQARPARRLEAGLEHMHRQAVVVVDHAGADARGQRAVAVGRETLNLLHDIHDRRPFFLFTFDVGGADDRPPAFDLGALQRAERFGLQLLRRRHHRAEIGQPLADRRRRSARRRPRC